MKTHLSVAVVSLALVFLLMLFGPAAQAGSVDANPSFRPARIRAFAPETASSVIVREGRNRYLRLNLADPCPVLAGAQRIAFQVGPALPVADGPGARVPVNRGALPAVISAATPHAYLVAIAPDRRTACRLASVATADRATFDHAAAAHGARDNRYAGDGRSSD
jgi:hypothetical protein